MYPKPTPEGPSTKEEGPDLEEMLPPPKPDEPDKTAPSKPAQPQANPKKAVSQPFPRLPRFR
jgi:hypothetical protein